MIRIIYAVLLLLSLTEAQFYSQRTKCAHNELSLDSELSLFYQNTQYQGVTLTQIIEILGMVKKIHHFGIKVDQPKIQNHRCRNYFMQTQICCRYSDLDQFTQKLVSLYSRTYYKSRHPMADYVYRIYDQYKSLNSYCLSNYDLRLPQRHGFTKQNATLSITNLILAIENEIRAVKQHQIDFIYNSACLWCMGIQDFKTLIHPINQDVKRSKRLIFNSEYFSNVTSMIANKMLNSKVFADQIDTFVQNQLRKRLNYASQCIPLVNLVNNLTQIALRKVCNTYDQCLKFAQKFIGAPGAPAYSKMFASVQLRRGITRTNFKVVTSTQWGFKGNTTYRRYVGRTVPQVQIKGNQYFYA